MPADLGGSAALAAVGPGTWVVLFEVVGPVDGGLDAHADKATVATPERTSPSAVLRLSVADSRSFDIDTIPRKCSPRTRLAQCIQLQRGRGHWAELSNRVELPTLRSGH